MERMQRRSPVDFHHLVQRSEERQDWTVVLEYDQEGQGPWIMDLSHLPRWDVQDRDLSQFQPCGEAIPEYPGQSLVTKEVVINRMNRTQASVWCMPGNESPMPQDQAYTDIRDNGVCLALAGTGVLALSEKVTNLDFAGPGHESPCLIQGPMAHVPCQIVLLSRDQERACFLFTCSRGYARDMVQCLLKAGREFGLRPAGEDRLGQFLPA